MKKITIGLFSLFALSTGGAAVLSAIPATAVAAPASPFWNWFWKSLAQLLFDWISTQIKNGGFNIHLKPGNPTPVQLDLSSIYSEVNRDAVAAEGVIITDSQITFEGDLVVKNDAEYTAVVKKGTYRVDAQRKSVLPIDIFQPSPTVPYPPGTLIR